MAKKAVIKYIDGSVTEILDWSHLNVMDTYLIFIFKEIDGVRMKTSKSFIISFSNLMWMEVTE